MRFEHLRYRRRTGADSIGLACRLSQGSQSPTSTFRLLWYFWYDDSRRSQVVGGRLP